MGNLKPKTIPTVGRTMRHFNIFCTFLLFFMMQNLHAQELSSHQWQNRLLLILVKDTLHPEFQNQLDALRSQAAGLAERDLLVYQVMPNQYRTGLSNRGKWIASAKLHSAYKQTDATFEVVMIGLDGGIKQCWTNPVSSVALFEVIDKMPMRRAEIGRKAN